MFRRRFKRSASQSAFRNPQSGDPQAAVPNPQSLEPEPSVLEAAARTRGCFVPAAFAVEVIAPDAVKRGFAAFGLKARVVATVVVDPQPEEEGCEAAAVDDGTGREVEHGKK